MMRKRSNDKRPILRSRHGTSENEGGESTSPTKKEKVQIGVSPKRLSRARTMSLKKCGHSGAEPLLVSSDTEDASCDFHTPLDANGTDVGDDFPVLSTRNLDDWKTNGNWVDFEQTPIATIPESPRKAKSKSSEDEEIRSPVKKKKKKSSDPMSPKKKSKEKMDKKKSAAAASKSHGDGCGDDDDDEDAKAVATTPKKAAAKKAVSIPKSPTKTSQKGSKPESLKSPTKKKKPKNVSDTPKTPKKTSKSKKTAEACDSKTAPLESPKKSSTKKSPKPTKSTAKKSTTSSKPTFSFCDTDDSSAPSSASEAAPITPKKKVNDEKPLKSPAKKSTKSKAVAEKSKRASSPSKKPKAVVKTRPEADSDEAADSVRKKIIEESPTTREISSPGKKKKEKGSKAMTTYSSDSEEEDQTEKAKESLHAKGQVEDAADGHVPTTDAKEKDDEDSSSSCSSGSDEGGESLKEAVWLNLTLNDAGTIDPPLPSSQPTSTESSSPSAPASPVKHLSLDDSDSSSDSDFEPTTPGGRPQGLSSYNEQKAAVAKRSPVPKTAESNSLANVSPGKDRMITTMTSTESSSPPEPAPSSPVKRLSLDDSDSSSDSSGGQQGYMVSYDEQRAAAAKRRPVPKKAASKSLANVSSLKDRMKFLQLEASSNTVPAQSPGKKAPSPEKEGKGVIASPQTQEIPYLDCSSHSRESENKTEVPAKRLSLDDSDSDSDSESPLIVCGRTLGISSLSPVRTSPVKRLSLDDSDSDSDSEPPMILGGRPLGISSNSDEQKTSPVPASPLKRLSLDDSDSSSDPDCVPLKVGGRPQAFLASYDEQRTAISKRRPVVERAASKSLENVSSLKDRMKFLQANESAKESKNPVTTTPRKAGLPDLKKPEVPRRAATKSLENVVSLKDRMNGNNFLSSGAQVCEPNGAMAIHEEDVSSSAKEGGNAVINSIPQLQHPRACRRSSASAISPLRGGACNSRFEELKRLAMKAAHEIASDDEGDGSTIAVKPTIPTQWSSTSVVSPLKNGEGNSRFQGLKWQAKKAAQDVALGDNKDDSGAVAQAAVPQQSSTSAGSPLRKGEGNSRFQELKRLAMKAAHEVASDDDEDNSNAVKQALPPRRSSTSAVPSKGNFWLRNPIVTTGGNTSGNESIQSPQISVMKLPKIQEHALDEGGNNTLPQKSSISAASPLKGKEVNSRFQELKRLAMKAAHEIASDDEGDGSTIAVKPTIPSRRSSTSAVSPLKNGKGNSRFQGLKWQAKKAAQDVALGDNNDGSDAVAQAAVPRRSSTSAVSPMKNGEGNSRFQGLKWQAKKAAQDVTLGDNKDGRDAVVQAAVPQWSSTTAVSPLRNGEGNSRFQELKRLAMKAAHEVASDDDDDEDNSNAVKQAVPPRRSSTSAVPPLKGKFWLKNPSATAGGNRPSNNGIQPPPPLPTVVKPSKFQELRQQAMRLTNEAGSSHGSPKSSPTKFQKRSSFQSTNVPKMKLWKLDDSPSRQVEALVSPRRKIKSKPSQQDDSDGSSLEELRKKDAELRRALAETLADDDDYDSDDDDASESSSNSDDSLEKLRKREAELLLEIEDTLHGSSDDDDDDDDENDSGSDSDSDQDAGDRRIVEVAAVVPPPSPTKRLSLDDSSSSSDSDGFAQNFCAGGTNFAEQQRQARRRAPPPGRHPSQSLANVTSLKDRKNMFSSK